MGRRVDSEPVEPVDPIRRALRAAQRALLEAVALESPLYARHEACLMALGKRAGAAKRLKVYERTVREARATRRYRELLAR